MGYLLDIPGTPSLDQQFSRAAILEKAVMQTLLKELTRPSQFGSSLVVLARLREIRTLRDRRCKLPFWYLTFLNYTKMTKYEALQKNAVSEPKMPQPGNLQYSHNSRKAHFDGRFSAYSLMEKSGGGA